VLAGQRDPAREAALRERALETQQARRARLLSDAALPEVHFVELAGAGVAAIGVFEVDEAVAVVVTAVAAHLRPRLTAAVQTDERHVRRPHAVVVGVAFGGLDAVLRHPSGSRSSRMVDVVVVGRSAPTSWACSWWYWSSSCLGRSGGLRNEAATGES
jgi:hypothetical protein